MPMSEKFQERLNPILEDIVQYYGTPFYVYDETGIRETGEKLISAFSRIEMFREFFAVKALPNFRILKIMSDLEFGFDCSSIPELILSRMTGASGEDIMFTSNNTSPEDFEAALSDGGAILNLDDISLIDKVPDFPELISFRYNPGDRRTGNSIIGNPTESKYGVSHEQIIKAYRKTIDRGAKRFGLHTMMASNELDYQYIVKTTKMLIDLADFIFDELGIKMEFINIGGGIGIPYTPFENPIPLGLMAKEITDLFEFSRQKKGYMPAVFMESGRYMTGPHGLFITRAINQKNTYRKYIGVDASISSLMRPAMYGAYHHITVHGKESGPSDEPVDVVGSLCENNDKFAIQRLLPRIDEDDVLIIHDAGAHCHAMASNYNGRLRPKEILLRSDGSVELIRRAETPQDYLRTQEFEPKTMSRVYQH